MKTTERRKSIATLLAAEQQAISGGTLAEKFGVSRQIIVQDISVLKAMGYKILSTHSGYILQSSPLKEQIFKLHHTTEQTKEELNTIIDLGGTVVDVFVWHKVYGKVQANLNITSALQVQQFIEGVRTGKSSELMNITGGYHYHTVRADSEEILKNIETALQKKGFLAAGN